MVLPTVLSLFAFRLYFIGNGRNKLWASNLFSPKKSIIIRPVIIHFYQSLVDEVVVLKNAFQLDVMKFAQKTFFCVKDYVLTSCDLFSK